MKAVRLGLAAFAWAASMFAQDNIDRRLAISIPDITGSVRQPFSPKDGLSALFFITTDCPVSNSYAREIRRICTSHAGHLNCYLVYTDPTVVVAAVAKHKQDYGHGDYPAIIDTNHALVKSIGATVTPEAALVSSYGELLYRGRIDDTYLIAGRRRPAASDHTLTDAIDAALAGKPIAHSRTKASGCFITPVELLKSVLAKPGLQ